MSQSFITVHSDLIEKLMEKYTLLPVRFGTFLENESQVKELLNQEGDRYKALLARVEGKVEMGLKALWENSGEACQTLGNLGKKTTGKAYMLARLEQDKGHKVIAERAMQLGEEINNRFPWAEEKKVKYLVTPRMFYNASFLVEKPRIPQYWLEVKKLKTDFANLKFLASGPWPPYNFSSEPELAKEE